MDREGEAPAEPGFLAFLARREPRPPGFEMPSSDERLGASQALALGDAAKPLASAIRLDVINPNLN
jgi:hypothetical protein